MLISTAYAQTAAAGAGGAMMQFVPLLFIIVIFWLFLIRPQQKRMKAHQEMTQNLRRGDKVITGGGFEATVTKVIDDKKIEVEIASGVKAVTLKATVIDLVSRTEVAEKKSTPKPVKKNKKK